MSTVLVIDDDLDFSEIFSLILTEYDLAIWQAASAEEAFEILRTEEQFDLIFCDLHLPFTLEDGADQYIYSEEVGIRTIEELGWVYQERVPIIATSASPELDFTKLKDRLGPVPTLSKPIKREALEEILLAVEEHHSSFEETEEAAYIF